MFSFVVYSSQFIRRMKDFKIIVNQKKFVNDADYRHQTLKEASTIRDRDMQHLVGQLSKIEPSF